MVDTLVLGTSVDRRVGSSPTLGTKLRVLSNWLARLTVNQVFNGLGVRVPPLSQ